VGETKDALLERDDVSAVLLAFEPLRSGFRRLIADMAGGKLPKSRVGADVGRGLRDWNPAQERKRLHSPPEKEVRTPGTK